MELKLRLASAQTRRLAAARSLAYFPAEFFVLHETLFLLKPGFFYVAGSENLGMFLRPLQCLFRSPAIGKRISRIPIKRLVRDIKYFYREQDADSNKL